MFERVPTRIALILINRAFETPAPSLRHLRSTLPAAADISATTFIAIEPACALPTPGEPVAAPHRISAFAVLRVLASRDRTYDLGIKLRVVLDVISIRGSPSASFSRHCLPCRHHARSPGRHDVRQVQRRKQPAEHCALHET